MSRDRPAVVAYVSGHGFGHFTRSQPVLAELSRAGVGVHLRTSDRALSLARRCRGFLSVEEVDLGPGTAQQGPLAVDLPATRAALQQHLARWPRIVEEEARVLRDLSASLVYADVPPIAFAAAARAGVPSVALGNFSWSWIYEGYAGDDPWFDEAARFLRQAEAQAALCLALDLGGGLEVFPRRAPIPPIARPPTLAPAEVRRRLALDERDPRPVVLLSFGGFGEQLDLASAAERNPGYRLVAVSARIDARLPNLQSFDPTDELTHPDLVAAADCVLGKPGYGTVAECLHRPTPLVYVPRGAFREYPALVDGIRRYLPSAELSPEELLAGRWSSAIERALSSTPPEVAPVADGAVEAARRILSLIGDRVLV